MGYEKSLGLKEVLKFPKIQTFFVFKIGERFFRGMLLLQILRCILKGTKVLRITAVKCGFLLWKSS